MKMMEFDLQLRGLRFVRVETTFFSKFCAWGQLGDPLWLVLSSVLFGSKYLYLR